jgi:hypothetical protein
MMKELDAACIFPPENDMVSTPENHRFSNPIRVVKSQKEEAKIEGI